MLTGIGYLTAHTKWYNSFHLLMMEYIMYIYNYNYIYNFFNLSLEQVRREWAN